MKKDASSVFKKSLLKSLADETKTSVTTQIKEYGMFKNCLEKSLNKQTLTTYNKQHTDERVNLNSIVATL